MPHDAPAMHFFEHGVRVSGGATAPSHLKRLATTDLPIYSGYSLTLIDSEGDSLNRQAIELLVPQGPYAVSDYLEEADLRYCLSGLLYHIDRLLSLYCAGCTLFENHHPVDRAAYGNFGDPRVFYEIDAALTAGRRVYESLRKVLWKHYSQPKDTSRWRSIGIALKSSGIIPEGYKSLLDATWNDFGEQLSVYRDCIAHYDPLTDGLTTCWMEPVNGRWQLTVKLPNLNGDKKGRQHYDFANGPDALTFCHMVAEKLVKLCVSLETEPIIAAFLVGARGPSA